MEDVFKFFCYILYFNFHHRRSVSIWIDINRKETIIEIALEDKNMYLRKVLFILNKETNGHFVPIGEMTSSKASFLRNNAQNKHENNSHWYYFKSKTWQILNVFLFLNSVRRSRLKQLVSRRDSVPDFMCRNTIILCKRVSIKLTLNYTPS